MNMADLDLAEFDIRKALEIDPNNRYCVFFYTRCPNLLHLFRVVISWYSFMTSRDVKLEYKALKEKVKEFNKKDAKFYGNMFAKLNKLDGNSDVSFRLVISRVYAAPSCLVTSS